MLGARLGGALQGARVQNRGKSLLIGPTHKSETHAGSSCRKLGAAVSFARYLCLSQLLPPVGRHLDNCLFAISTYLESLRKTQLFLFSVGELDMSRVFCCFLRVISRWKEETGTFPW